MNKSLKKVLMTIVIICVLVLLIDFAILIYYKYFKIEKKLVFDGINYFEVVDTGVIAVGSNSNNDNAYEKAKITLYDSKYKKLWETLYNRKYSSSFSSVKKDDDDYVAVGSYEANKQEHDDQVRSAVIVKFDKDGNFLCDKRFQVLGNSKFNSLLVVDDGYIVVGQSIYENMTLGTSDEGGAFIIKYDKELNELWRKNYGGSKSGVYNDLVIQGDYIYAVGKDFARTGIISKYTLDGEYVSTTMYNYTDTIGFTGIISDNNYLYVVGSKKVSEDKNDYDTDAIIVKYSFDLVEISNKLYKDKGMERYNRLIIDSNSNIIVVGQSGVYDKRRSTKELNVFSYDGIIAKYSIDLDELLVEKYDDEEDDFFTNIVEKNNLYVISGYSKYDGSYLPKFITYTKSGKLKDVFS